MNAEANSVEKHKGLNGLRIPILVNGVTLIPVLGVLVGLYSDVQQLKSDRIDRITGERMAKLEATVAQGVDNRYRAGDAVRDFALRDAEIQRLREDMKVLEDRIERGRK